MALSHQFITFEGGDGSGKSTQSRLLVEALHKRGVEVIHTREPGGTESAERIRELLVTGDVEALEPASELLLHIAARNEHISRVIKPALEKGVWVVCDRFTDSTHAYQVAGHGLPKAWLDWLTENILQGLKPDRTFVLDVGDGKGLARAATRDHEENRYEAMGSDYHRRINHCFREIAEAQSERCILIPAGLGIDEVHRKVIVTLGMEE